MKNRMLVNGKRHPYVMRQGPLHGQTLYMERPGTLPFTLNGQTGHYNQSNDWIPA